MNACQRNAQLNGDNKLGSLLSDGAKRLDNNWKVLSVDTERPGCTVSVTKGDTNDAQLELAVAGRCLRFLRNSGITTLLHPSEGNDIFGFAPEKITSCLCSAACLPPFVREHSDLLRQLSFHLFPKQTSFLNSPNSFRRLTSARTRAAKEPVSNPCFVIFQQMQAKRVFF